MADKDTSPWWSLSEQTTIEPKEYPSSRQDESASEVSSRGRWESTPAWISTASPLAEIPIPGRGTQSAPAIIGQAPPGHWMDMAQAGLFSQQAPRKKGRLEKLQERIEKQFTPKTTVKPWGSVPEYRREFFFLEGEQSLPLGQNRWKRFAPEVQTKLSAAAASRGPRSAGLVLSLEDDERRQLWLGTSVGVNREIAGMSSRLWHPEGQEQPDSALLQTGRGTTREGFFMGFAEEEALVRDYNNAAYWTRAEKPRVRVVLMVQETYESAVQEHCTELSSKDYVLRVFNNAGFPVVGLKKNDLKDHTIRDLRIKFEAMNHGRSGELCFIVPNGRELHAGESLKTLCQRYKQLDIHPLYLTESQVSMKRAGVGQIIGGRFADLHQEGWFMPEPANPTQAPGCGCVVS